MNESRKVQSHHLERDAYLYIRQSSMKQVIENIESTKRQYALRGRATALGWVEDRIVVIDSDQGESGASAAWRDLPGAMLAGALCLARRTSAPFVSRRWG